MITAMNTGNKLDQEFNFNSLAWKYMYLTAHIETLT